MVSDVFDELMQGNSVMPGAASDSESSSGLYSVVCLFERLMPGSQELKGGRVSSGFKSGGPKDFSFGIALQGSLV